MVQQQPSNQPSSYKTSLQILWIANSLIVGLLAVWLILSNFLAAQQEMVLQAELNKFAQRFPKTKTNPSAIQLSKLSTKLGVLTPNEENNHIPPSEAARKSYDAIRKPLHDYLNTQILKPNDHIDALPKPIRQYLNVHTINLSTVRNHILRSEIPRWESPDFQQSLEPLFPQPSFLSLVHLQRLLLVDALEANRLGQFQQALDGLTASWKLNQSLYERPTLIPLLMALIISNQQTGVLRKINHLPPKWQQQLPKPDIQKSLLTVFEGESFYRAESLRIYSLQREEFWQSINSIHENLGGNKRTLEESPLAKFQQVFQQPYFRLVAAAERSRVRHATLNLFLQDICALDNQTWLEKHSGDWWYSIGYLEAMTLNQWQKAYRNLINQELTQKILQVKALVAQSDRVPQAVPGFEKSTVCSSLRWKYQVSGGTMLISLQNPPQWLVMRKGDLPLNYQLSLPNRAKQNLPSKTR